MTNIYKAYQDLFIDFLTKAGFTEEEIKMNACSFEMGYWVKIHSISEFKQILEEKLNRQRSMKGTNK